MNDIRDRSHNLLNNNEEEGIGSNGMRRHKTKPSYVNINEDRIIDWKNTLSHVSTISYQE